MPHARSSPRIGSTESLSDKHLNVVQDVWITVSLILKWIATELSRLEVVSLFPSFSKIGLLELLAQHIGIVAAVVYDAFRSSRRRPGTKFPYSGFRRFNFGYALSSRAPSGDL